MNMPVISGSSHDPASTKTPPRMSRQHGKWRRHRTLVVDPSPATFSTQVTQWEVFFPPLYLSSNFKGSADHRSPQWKEICADTNPGRSIEALVANHEITVILPVMQLAPHCIHYSILLRFAAKWSYNFRGRGNLWSKIKYTLEVKLNKLLAWTSDDQFVRSSPKFVYSRIFNSRFTVYMSSYDLHFAPPFSSYFRWQSWFLYCL